MIQGYRKVLQYSLAHKPKYTFFVKNSLFWQNLLELSTNFMPLVPSPLPMLRVSLGNTELVENTC